MDELVVPVTEVVEAIEVGVAQFKLIGPMVLETGLAQSSAPIALIV